MSIYSSYLTHAVFRGIELEEEWLNHVLSLPLKEQLCLLREKYIQSKPISNQVNRARNRAYSLVRILPPRYNPKVYLDFGGADGQITAQLARILQPRRAICADLTEWQNMHHHLTRDESVEFLPLESSDIPLLESSVDFCTALQVLHHVPDVEKSIRELYRVLRPGGYLLVREHDCITKDIAQRLDWVHYLYEIVVAEKPNWAYLEHQTRYHSVVEWIELFRDFRLVNIQPAREEDINQTAHLLFQKK